jgi:uncharacterized protein YndB with AHSA1/START domain
MDQSITRTLILKAPLDKAWNAIATPEGFHGWFSAKVEGDWKEGEAVLLRWPSGNANEIRLNKIQPKSLFVYQWHPGEYNKLDAYPESELTTITMRLREVPDGTELSLVESGFENVSEDRRLKVLGLNTEGWEEELENIRKYVEA